MKLLLFAFVMVVVVVAGVESVSLRHQVVEQVTSDPALELTFHFLRGNATNPTVTGSCADPDRGAADFGVAAPCSGNPNVLCEKLTFTPNWGGGMSGASCQMTVTYAGKPACLCIVAFEIAIDENSEESRGFLDYLGDFLSPGHAMVSMEEMKTNQLSISCADSCLVRSNGQEWPIIPPKGSVTQNIQVVPGK